VTPGYESILLESFAKNQLILIHTLLLFKNYHQVMSQLKTEEGLKKGKAGYGRHDG
jgi:hypothetical protein